MLEMISTVFCVGSKPHSKRVRLAIRWPRVCVPLWPLARFVLGRPKLKSSATLVNYSQLVASCLVLVGLFVSNYLSGVSVNYYLGQNRWEVCTPAPPPPPLKSRIGKWRVFWLLCGFAVSSLIWGGWFAVPVCFVQDCSWISKVHFPL